MGSLSKSESKQELQTKQIPGVFGTPGSARLAGMAEQRIGQASPLQSLMEQIALGTTPTAGQQALTSAISGITGAAPQDLQSALAQSLVAQRGTELGQTLGAGRAFETQRGGAIQALLELAGLAMPQVVAGQRITGESAPYDPTGISGTPLDVFIDPVGGQARGGKLTAKGYLDPAGSTFKSKGLFG